MPSRDILKVAFLITWKKVCSAKINYLLLFALIFLLVYIWQKDSFSLSLRLFLYLFPYVFLFLSQDLARDEIDCGCLESVLFLNGEFRAYLLAKSFFLAVVALACSLVLLSGLATFGFFTRQFSSGYFLQFLAGVVAGFYYLSLGGLLSFFFKGGSNVLIVILGQAFLFMALLLSATHSAGFINSLDKASFPDLASRLGFLALTLLFPNVLAAKRFSVYGLGIVLFGFIFFYLQKIRIKNLELDRR